MHFSEDDLRQALKRKDPGSQFTEKVMARVTQKEKRVPIEDRRGWLAWLGAVRLRPAMTAVAATLVVAVASWIGYEQYHAARIERARQAEQAQQAEQKAILALRITSTKLNHILRRVNESSVEEPKIRRRSL